MSPKLSPRKSGIPSLDDYYLALDLYSEARDRINSGGTGMGYSGIHYIVMQRIKQFGSIVEGREAAVAELGRLLREFEKTHFGSDNTSDEDFLSKHEDEL
jgi:hypothetical protein